VDANRRQLWHHPPALGHAIERRHTRLDLIQDAGGGNEVIRRDEFDNTLQIALGDERKFHCEPAG
jgi:hypothetical protein